MKTKLLISFIFLSTLGFSAAEESLFAAPTHTKITKSNRGLFGYKTVTESSTGDMVVLACANPGKLECKRSAMNTSIPSVLTPTQIDEISAHVDELIFANPVNGSYIYQNDYLVLYTVGTVITNVTIDILTRSEALERGITI